MAKSNSILVNLCIELKDCTRFWLIFCKKVFPFPEKSLLLSTSEYSIKIHGVHFLEIITTKNHNILSVSYCVRFIVWLVTVAVYLLNGIFSTEWKFTLHEKEWETREREKEGERKLEWQSIKMFCVCDDIFLIRTETLQHRLLVEN